MTSVYIFKWILFEVGCTTSGSVAFQCPISTGSGRWQQSLLFHSGIHGCHFVLSCRILEHINGLTPPYDHLMSHKRVISDHSKLVAWASVKCITYIHDEWMNAWIHDESMMNEWICDEWMNASWMQFLQSGNIDYLCPQHYQHITDMLAAYIINLFFSIPLLLTSRNNELLSA